MECGNCGTQWTFRSKQIQLTNCPFCGSPLTAEEPQEIYTNFLKALRAIVRMNGADFLIRNPSRTLGIFGDITKNLQKEYRMLKLFYSNDTQNFFQDLAHTSEGNLHKAIRSLRENVFMDPDSARYIVAAFACALDVPAPAKKAKPASNVSQKNPVSAPVSRQVRPEDLKKDMLMEWKDHFYRIEEVQHVHSGKGEPSVRVILEALRDKERRVMAFRSSETKIRTFLDYNEIRQWMEAKISAKAKPAPITRTVMQYLHFDGHDYYYFMNPDTYDQIRLDRLTVGNALKYIMKNDMVTICFCNKEAIGVVPPPSVQRTVLRTRKAVPYDFDSKPAIAEPDIVVEVPFFIQKGDVIEIDTRTGTYIGKV